MMVELMVASLLGVLIGSVTLWAAARLYNRLARSDGQFVVPEPTPRKAMGITIVVILSGYGTQFALECWDNRANCTIFTDRIQLHMAAVALSLVVSAILVSVLLPTTARRAILVVLLQTAMEIMIVVLLLAAVAAYSALKQ
jgi:hypothetical protein